MREMYLLDKLLLQGKRRKGRRKGVDQWRFQPQGCRRLEAGLTTVQVVSGSLLPALLGLTS